jgi:hypothetical protein
MKSANVRESAASWLSESEPYHCSSHMFVTTRSVATSAPSSTATPAVPAAAVNITACGLSAQGTSGFGFCSASAAWRLAGASAGAWTVGSSATARSRCPRARASSPAAAWQVASQICTSARSASLSPGSPSNETSRGTASAGVPA